MTETDGVDAIIEQWRRERPELDHSPIGVVGRISRLAREIEARLEVVYREQGLEPGWHDVLATPLLDDRVDAVGLRHGRDPTARRFISGSCVLGN